MSLWHTVCDTALLQPHQRVNKQSLWSSCLCQLLFQCQRAGPAPTGRGAHRYLQLHFFQQLGRLRER